MRFKDVLPAPKSGFLKVKCVDCGNIQTVFSKSSNSVGCSVCGATLAEPTGGNALIKGEIVERLE